MEKNTFPSLSFPLWGNIFQSEEGGSLISGSVCVCVFVYTYSLARLLMHPCVLWKMRGLAV